MNTMLKRLIITLCLLLILAPAAVYAAGTSTLLAIDTRTVGDTERIDIDFTYLPTYKVVIGNKRVDLILPQTGIDNRLKKPAKGVVVRDIRQGQDGDQVAVSFNFDRQPAGVDAAFVLRNSIPADTIITTPARLALAVTYETPATTVAQSSSALNILPEKALPTPDSKDKEIAQPTPLKAEKKTIPPKVSKPRPAIAPNLPGTNMAIAGLVSSKHINSPYKGRWKDFFQEHSTPLSIPVDIHYSLPPFPVISLAQPGAEQKYLSLLTLAQGRAGMWEDVLSALKNQSREPMSSEMKAAVLLTYGETLLRTGNPDLAFTTLKMMPTEHSEAQIEEWGRYLKAAAQAATGEPYQTAYDLAHFQRTQYSTPILIPYLNMLKVEAAIATEQYDEAQKILNKDMTGYPENVRQMLGLRQADVWAATDRSARAASYYGELEKQETTLAAHPSSLARYAEILLTSGRYAEATTQYNRLTIALANKPGEDLAFFAKDISIGAYNRQILPLLQHLTERYPGTEGAVRARLKANDLAVLADTDNAKLVPMMAEYKEIATLAPLRELREEAAFKEALTMYLSGDMTRATHMFQGFLRDYASGSLRIHAQTLMIELLPVTVREMVASKEYLKALVLAEQNRDLLVSGHISNEFLTELGLAFAGLCIWNRAIRVYRYLLDISTGTAAEEEIYQPLIESLYESDDYDQVEAYASHYLKHYPAGRYKGAILRLRVEALHKTDKTEEAGAVLRKNDVSTNKELNSLAGRIFWELEEYDQVDKYLSRNMGLDLTVADLSDVSLRAEALFKEGNTATALPLFEFLIDSPDHADQALYRTAQIQMARKKPGQGVKLLQQLAEKGKSPLWKKMAVETLAINAEIQASR